MDESSLSFTDTTFAENACYDGCLVHNEGPHMALDMTRVVATKNWAFQTAALVFVDNIYTDDDGEGEDTHVDIKDS